MIGLELRSEVSIQDITEFLEKFHPPALQDVTVEFRVVDTEIIYAFHKNDVDNIEACLELEAALRKFPQHRISFPGSRRVHARRHLWMRELGSLFPTLRDGNRLNIDCEPSEISDQSSLII